MTKICKYCKSEMNSSANICPICNSHQNWLIKNLFNFTSLISIAFLVLAVLQFIQSSREKEETTKALAMADTSLAAANIAMHKADSSFNASNSALEYSLLIKKEVEETAFDMLNLIETTNNLIVENSRGVVTDDTYNLDKVKSLSNKIKMQLESLKKKIGEKE